MTNKVNFNIYKNNFTKCSLEFNTDDDNYDFHSLFFRLKSLSTHFVASIRNKKCSFSSSFLNIKRVYDYLKNEKFEISCDELVLRQLSNYDSHYNKNIVEFDFSKFFKRDFRKSQKDLLNFTAACHSGVLWEGKVGSGKTSMLLASLLVRNVKFMLILMPGTMVLSGHFEREAAKIFKDEILESIVIKAIYEKSSKETGRVLEESLNNSYNLIKAGKRVILILSYSSFWRKGVFEKFFEHPALLMQGLMACDESHRIKAHNSEQSENAYKLGQMFKFRIACTGTPFSDKPVDIYGQARFVNDGIFDSSFSRFYSEYVITNEFRKILGYRNLDDLIKRTAPFFYSCSTPETTENPLEVIRLDINLTEDEKRHYKLALNQAVKENGEGKLDNIVNALAKLNTLQQICSGFTYDNTLEKRKAVLINKTTSSKIKAIEELLDSITSPVLIFYKYTEDFNQILKHFNKFDFAVFNSDKKDFDKIGKADHYIIQQQCGEGIDGLQFVTHICVFVSYGYSYASREQNIGRLHRPGQSEQVIVYDLVSKHTVESKLVYPTLLNKKITDSELAESFKKMLDKF